MTEEDDPMLKYCKCNNELEWRGCYESETEYKKYIHPDSMKHPAKMALPLCERIFQHLEQLGDLKPGVTVVDPMSGTGRTNIVASLRGYNSISIELEDKFVKMQEQNREIIKADGWSIVKGDARNLSELLGGGAIAGVTSPPYQDSRVTAEGQFRSAGEPDRPDAKELRTENMGYSETKPLVAITSPPYGNIEKRDRSKDESAKTETQHYRGDRNISSGYQGDSHNIGNLKDTPLVGVVSPPHGDTLKGGGGPNYYQFLQQAKGLSPEEWKKAEREWQRNQKDNMARYSQDDKNIGNLKDVAMVGVTSPPFLDAQTGGGIAKNGYRGKHMRGQGRNQPDKMGERCGYCKDVHGVAEGQIGNMKDQSLAGVTSPPYESCDQAFHDESALKYIKGGKPRDFKMSENPINVGNQTGETYQSAMLRVYQESFKAGISPLVVVTKNPTKNKQIRRLDLDTVALLEAAGYEIYDYHRAILFEIVHQQNLDGTVKKIPKGRLSFFKRLSFSKGSPVAQYEDVIFGRIPEVSNK